MGVVELLPPPEPRHRASVLEVLAECTEQAEAGEIESLVVVMIRPGGVAAYNRSEMDRGVSLVGALEWTKQQILEDFD